MVELFFNFRLLFTESAPFLLLGLALAGAIKLLIPEVWIQTLLGNNTSVILAALIGTPLPLCSCSVIPAAIAVRRAGASKASTASFMVATPETGIDSIGITLALMGPVMAIARPIAAITSAITAGLLVRWWDPETTTSNKEELSMSPSGSCCQHAKTPSQKNGWLDISKRILSYGYGQLLADFMTWLLIGLFFASLIQTYIPTTFFAQYGDGLIGMLIVIILSIPMYICATASTPIAVGLMLSGLSPGTALVFMLTGPATNIATLMVVKKELGKRSLMAYLIGVVISALIMGLGFNALFDYWNINIELNQSQHHSIDNWLYNVSAALLASLIVWQYIKKYRAIKSINTTI